MYYLQNLKIPSNILIDFFWQGSIWCFSFTRWISPLSARPRSLPSMTGSKSSESLAPRWESVSQDYDSTAIAQWHFSGGGLLSWLTLHPPGLDGHPQDRRRLGQAGHPPPLRPHPCHQQGLRSLSWREWAYFEGSFHYWPRGNPKVSRIYWIPFEVFNFCCILGKSQWMTSRSDEVLTKLSDWFRW